MKKKILAFTLAMLMLVSCGCATVPASEDEENVYIADIEDNADLINLASADSNELRETPSDKAYVRGGDYASNNYKNETTLVVKKGDDSKPNDTREILLEFDLTKISKFNFKKVFLTFTWTATNQKEHNISIYRVDPDSWDGAKVTYNTKPTLGELICEATVNSLSTKVDMTAAVNEAIENGEKKLSLCIVGTKKYQGDADKLNSKLTTLVATAGDSVSSYVYQLVEDEAENQAIWAWAKELVKDWFTRYLELSKVESYPAELIVSDADEFTKTVYSTGSGSNNNISDIKKAFKTRTYDALDDLGDYTDYDAEYDFDVYGGWMDPSMRQEATGFFYSKKIGERWWFIDPLGYPCYMRTISGPHISYSGSVNQKAVALEKYGTEEKWEIATVRWLKDELYFNASRVLSSVELPTVTEMSGVGMASGYGNLLGTNTSTGGSTTFKYGTLNVFDPGFVDFCDQRAAEVFTDPNNPWITGYTTDNELPMATDLLLRYLQVDLSDETNYYSYATAWTWFLIMTGKDNPTIEDANSELLDLFRGFVYDRYFKVVDEAMDQYDPNHMNLGCRFLTAVKNAPWVLRFASLYVDCITINWYNSWQPEADDIYQICQNMDLPMMVTEFYTKAAENDGSFDDPNDPLKNTCGWGWLVRTQQDRADFYQNFTLRMLECKNFVGWQWHQYIDNDDGNFEADGTPKDTTNVDANKGIVNNWHEPYEELCEAMAEINKNVYRLALHFDAKYAAKNAK